MTNAVRVLVSFVFLVQPRRACTKDPRVFCTRALLPTFCIIIPLRSTFSSFHSVSHHFASLPPPPSPIYISALHRVIIVNTRVYTYFQYPQASVVFQWCIIDLTLVRIMSKRLCRTRRFCFVARLLPGPTTGWGMFHYKPPRFSRYAN